MLPLGKRVSRLVFLSFQSQDIRKEERFAPRHRCGAAFEDSLLLYCRPSLLCRNLASHFAVTQRAGFSPIRGHGSTNGPALPVHACDGREAFVRARARSDLLIWTFQNVCGSISTCRPNVCTQHRVQQEPRSTLESIVRPPGPPPRPVALFRNVASPFFSFFCEDTEGREHLVGRPNVPSIEGWQRPQFPVKRRLMLIYLPSNCIPLFYFCSQFFDMFWQLSNSACRVHVKRLEGVHETVLMQTERVGDSRTARGFKGQLLVTTEVCSGTIYYYAKRRALPS